MITHYSLHGYFGTCLLHLEDYFILYFPFILEVGPNVCHTILKPIMAYPCIEYWSGIQLCYPIHIYARLLPPCFLWKNINNDTLNTFKWNVTMIIPCACGFILWSFRTIVKVFLSDVANSSNDVKKCQHLYSRSCGRSRMWHSRESFVVHSPM
jgi:hypothetical protein